MPMNVILHIEELRLHEILGVLEYERKKKQEIIIDAKIGYEFEGKYLDYVRVVEFIKNDVKVTQYLLIEDLGKNLSQKLFAEFRQIHEIYLKVKKIETLQGCIVGASFKFFRI